MKISKDLLKLFLIPIVFLFGILVAGVFTIFYTTTIKTDDGKLQSTDWPKNFTYDFAEYINVEQGKIGVAKEGKALLQENHLWLQILDMKGEEIYSCYKPAKIPSQYQPYELLQTYQTGDGKSSVFVSSIEGEGTSCVYLIGFPVSLSKVVTYIDTARYQSGKEKKIFREIYEGIYLLNQDIEKTDRQREKDETARKEWLANITHDLKTPLAPIRGYAELLAEGKEQSPERINHYGAVILKNVMYTEQLVNDLKLVYQLQSNLLPLKKEKQNFVRFIKEIIIDLLNSPEYEKRLISYIFDQEDIEFEFDSSLLRRAVSNMIVNALKHNGQDTKITVTLHIHTGAEIELIIADDGKGMTKQELNGLFERYYRGTNTETGTEGSGLGMAIAKQIIEAHGGSIEADSKVNVGTIIKVML